MFCFQFPEWLPVSSCMWAKRTNAPSREYAITMAREPATFATLRWSAAAGESAAGFPAFVLATTRACAKARAATASAFPTCEFAYILLRNCMSRACNSWYCNHRVCALYQYRAQNGFLFLPLPSVRTGTHVYNQINRDELQCVMYAYKSAIVSLIL